MTATAHGPYGNYAISSDGWNVPTMTNVIATARDGQYNTAVENKFSAMMTNVTATASGGRIV